MITMDRVDKVKKNNVLLDLRTKTEYSSNKKEAKKTNGSISMQATNILYGNKKG